MKESNCDLHEFKVKDSSSAFGILYLRELTIAVENG